MIGEFAKKCELKDIKGEIMEQYKKFTKDEQDLMRKLSVKSLVHIKEALQDNQADLVQGIIVHLGQDNSWRVRQELARLFPEIIAGYDKYPQKKENLIKISANLLADQEKEVKLVAIR